MKKIDNKPNLEIKFSGSKPVESSLCRKIREIVTKIFFDCWVSAFSYFRKVDNRRKIEREDSSFSMLTRLRGISRHTMIDCGHALCDPKSKHRFVSTGVWGINSAFGLYDIKQDDTHVCIPITLIGRIISHSVAIFIDRPNSKIEYYDPLGLTINDQNDPFLRSVLQEIGEKYTGYELIENTRKHQYDRHNCGIYVLDYFDRRLKGESAEDVFANRKGSSLANGEIRVRLLNRLYDANRKA